MWDNSHNSMIENVRPGFPNIFATLRRTQFSPPLRSFSDPSLAFFLRVHRFGAPTGLEVFQFVTEFCQLAISIEQVDLTCNDDRIVECSDTVHGAHLTKKTLTARV